MGKIQTRFALVFATAFPLSPDADDYASGDLPKYAIGLIMLGILLLILAYMWTVFKRLPARRRTCSRTGSRAWRRARRRCATRSSARTTSPLCCLKSHSL